MDHIFLIKYIRASTLFESTASSYSALVSQSTVVFHTFVSKFFLELAHDLNDVVDGIFVKKNRTKLVKIDHIFLIRC